MSEWFFISSFLMLAVLTVLALVAKSRKNLRLIDIFTVHHNYKVGKPMKLKKTIVGGFFTLILGLVILYLLFTALIFYFIDNVSETKASIPIVIVN